MADAMSGRALVQNLMVGVHLDEPEMAILTRAVAFRHRPEGWQPAEYAMSKLAAYQALAELQHGRGGDVKLAIFAWGVLAGELARLGFYGPDDCSTRAGLLIKRINFALDSVPVYRRMMRVAAGVKESLRKAEALDAAAAALTAEITARQADLQTAMVYALAADQPGG